MNINLMKTSQKNFCRVLFIASTLISFLLAPNSIFADIDSSNYSLQGPSFNNGGAALEESGGGYKSQLSIGEEFNNKLESTNYDARSGFNYEILANVPLAPTVTNDTGQRYDRLKFVINVTNANDQTNGTKFAIQLSNDNFSSNIWYVQDDNSISTTLGIEDYQTYSNWGGASGEYALGLTDSTTYQFRVRAFNGDATESEWGPSASASTIEPRLGLAITAGSCTPTTSTVTGNSIDFGSVNPGTQYTCTHTITSSTNAESGFVTTLKGNQVGLTSGGNDIDGFSGSWTTPASWTSPAGTTSNVNTGFIGYTSDDTTIETGGGGNKFSTASLWAALETTAREIASSTAPAISGQANVVSTRLEVNTAQASGTYNGLTVTYEITGTF